MFFGRFVIVGGETYLFACRPLLFFFNYLALIVIIITVRPFSIPRCAFEGLHVGTIWTRCCAEPAVSVDCFVRALQYWSHCVGSRCVDISAISQASRASRQFSPLYMVREGNGSKG